MRIWDIFLSWFKKDGTLNISEKVGSITTEIWYKELAIQSSINLISNTISIGEFLTFENREEVKKDNYYLLNVEPNQNKSASKFWRDVVSKLIYYNECLVVQINGMFYVADGFNVDKYALLESVYRDIKIDDYKLKESKPESEVFHFELHNNSIRKVIDGLYSSYGKLIATSFKHNLRKKSKKGILNIPGNYPQTDEYQKDLKDLLENRLKAYFESESDAVLPLSNGLTFEEKDDQVSNSHQEGREIKAFIDDIFDFVAIGFQIPPKLLKGDVADTTEAVDNLLTFCINPIAEVLNDEINRKLYGKKLFLEGTYTKLDTTRIKHVNIEDTANALDVLFRIGANTINDNLRILGRETIDHPYANERFITKNYNSIEQLLKGGDD